MSVRLECPSCGKGLRVPETAAGRRVMCPRCDEAVRVPQIENSLDEDLVPAEAEQPREPSLGEALRTPEGLGAASLFLGLASVPVMIVPFVGYAALASSAFGFLLGLAGLLRSWVGSEHLGDGTPALAGGIAGVQPRRFPLAGAAVCLVTFALALLPLVHHG
jgi:hypothetical protein